MIDPTNVTPVEPSETLARYVVHGSHIRRASQTVKPDVFMPHPHQDLSVTRHMSATEHELWVVGEAVAAASAKILHGRADIQAADCLSRGLVVRAAPLTTNPNHADVSGWPADKPAQKIVALEIAAVACFVARI